MADGSPLLTPVWVTHDGEHILVNTARGRQKLRNLRKDRRIAITVVAEHDVEVYVQIRAHVSEFVEGQPAADSFRELMLKYRGNRDYYRFDENARILLKITPAHITSTAVYRAEHNSRFQPFRL